MSRLEQLIFFKLLERYTQRNEWKLAMPNGLLCLLPNLDYDVVIKKSTIMRKESI